MKRCSKCKECKPATEFRLDRHQQDGLYASCRACNNRNGCYPWPPLSELDRLALRWVRFTAANGPEQLVPAIGFNNRRAA